MQAVILVGAGGAIGAMARYGVSIIIGRLFRNGFPFATLTVNILGSILMGILIGVLARTTPQMSNEIRLFAGIGVLGGFTTFSSFSLDTIVLIERGAVAQALLYVGLSVVICLVGLYLGLLISRGSMA